MNKRVVLIAASVLLLGATPTPPPDLTNRAIQILEKLGGDAIAPYAVDPNHVRGTVTYFRRFDLQVQMPLDTYKQIHLHQGTIINPRGASLQNGQTVDVRGTANGDGTLNADEITIIHG